MSRFPTVVLAFSSLSVAACAAHRQVLINPAGQSLTCWANGTDPSGVAQVDNSMEACLRRAHTDGFIEIERAGAVGLLLADGELRVLQARPNTPAATAGVVAGDFILKVGGLEVRTPEEAGRLLLGEIGQPVEVTFRMADASQWTVTMVRIAWTAIYGAGAPPVPVTS